jgi:hypothetical protein
MFKMGPVTLVVEEALLVMVVRARSNMLPVSVSVCEPVSFVLEEDKSPIFPANEAVAEEEVKAPESNPPEVMVWEAEVTACVVEVVAVDKPVIASKLLVASQPKPVVSEVILLVPSKKAIWPTVPEPVKDEVPEQVINLLEESTQTEPVGVPEVIPSA